MSLKTAVKGTLFLHIGGHSRFNDILNTAAHHSNSPKRYFHHTSSSAAIYDLPLSLTNWFHGSLKPAVLKAEPSGSESKRGKNGEAGNDRGKECNGFRELLSRLEHHLSMDPMGSENEKKKAGNLNIDSIHLLGDYFISHRSVNWYQIGLLITLAYVPASLRQLLYSPIPHPPLTSTPPVPSGKKSTRTSKPNKRNNPSYVFSLFDQVRQGFYNTSREEYEYYDPPLPNTDKESENDHKYFGGLNENFELNLFDVMNNSVQNGGKYLGFRSFNELFDGYMLNLYHRYLTLPPSLSSSLSFSSSSSPISGLSAGGIGELGNQTISNYWAIRGDIFRVSSSLSQALSQFPASSSFSDPANSHLNDLKHPDNPNNPNNLSLITISLNSNCFFYRNFPKLYLNNKYNIPIPPPLPPVLSALGADQPQPQPYQDKLQTGLVLKTAEECFNKSVEYEGMGYQPLGILGRIQVMIYHLELDRAEVLCVRYFYEYWRVQLYTILTADNPNNPNNLLNNSNSPYDSKQNNLLLALPLMLTDACSVVDKISDPTEDNIPSSNDSDNNPNEPQRNHNNYHNYNQNILRYLYHLDKSIYKYLSKHPQKDDFPPLPSSPLFSAVTPTTEFSDPSLEIPEKIVLNRVSDSGEAVKLVCGLSQEMRVRVMSCLIGYLGLISMMRGDSSGCVKYQDLAIQLDSEHYFGHFLKFHYYWRYGSIADGTSTHTFYFCFCFI